MNASFCLIWCAALAGPSAVADPFFTSKTFLHGHFSASSFFTGNLHHKKVNVNYT
jgi:hypothetical protein